NLLEHTGHFHRIVPGFRACSYLCHTPRDLHRKQGCVWITVNRRSFPHMDYGINPSPLKQRAQKPRCEASGTSPPPKIAFADIASETGQCITHTIRIATSI